MPPMTQDAQSSRTLPARWVENWRAHPTRVALSCEGVSLSGEELEHRSRYFAGILTSLGVGPGDRVVWEATSSTESVSLAIAIMRLGAVLVPVSERQRTHERHTVVSDVSPRLVVSANGLDLGDLDVRQLSLDNLHDIASDECVLDHVGLDERALIVYTSGTTGTPKGAMMTHRNLSAHASSLEQAWGWTADDRLLFALPLFHVHGLVAGLFTSLSCGSSTLVQSHFETQRFLGVMRDERATMSFCVPTMLHRLILDPDVGNVANLRLLVSGSAPLSVQLFHAFEEQGSTILERYGMTETLLTLSNPLVGPRRAGTVGLTLPGVQADLPQRGEQERELRISGPTVFQGYWNRPEATAEILEDGWLSTGDIVRLDDAGYAVICGRMKELIITGGLNVYPSEVEDMLRLQEGILDAAVVGVPSEEWGEEVVAYVINDAASLDVEGIQARLASVMSSYKIPKRFVTVDELPRNDLGKLQRHLLP